MTTLIFTALLAQIDGQDGRRPERSRVHLRLDEWFDESREDGATEGRHPRDLDVAHPNGRMTYNSSCHWKRRERRDVFATDDQEEEEKRPTPLPTPEPITPFKRVTGGAKFQFPTTLSVPTIRIESPADGVAVDFDEVDAESMPGAFLSTTLAFGDFEVTVFADYVTGRITGEAKFDFATGGGGHGGGGGSGVDTFSLDGTVWLMEIGVAPLLKRFATEDGRFAAEIAVAGGIYFGRMTDLTADREGSVSESIPLGDESLFGYFAGPTVHGSVGLSKVVRLGLLGEFWRMFGDVEGWTGLAGAELSVQF